PKSLPHPPKIRATFAQHPKPLQTTPLSCRAASPANHRSFSAMSSPTIPEIIPAAPGTPEKPYFGIDVPLMRYFGLQPELIEEGYCRTRLPAHPQLVNSRGDVHGGTLMATLDFTLSGAARSHAPTETGVITIDMSTHFLAAARGELTLEARCMR